MYPGYNFSFALGSILTNWPYWDLHRTGKTAVGPLNRNGIYDSSVTPSHLPWNTYNYCNAPHVNTEHYHLPEAENASLVYLNVVMRHHKRTPDNRYPNENELNSVPWNCSNFHQYSYGGGTTLVHHDTATPAWHPFLSQIWNGTCDQGQLTQAGLEDAIKHGKDFWSVYGDKLGFLLSVNGDDILFRTSTEIRTFQVVGGLITGMDPDMANKPFPVTTQPSAIDSIPPRYPCPKANAIRNAYLAVPAWTTHLVENAQLKSRLDHVLGTGDLQDWGSWYDHYFDTFTARTCHGHPLPCTANGNCISSEDAADVFSLGDFEYNYIWNAAENATMYSQLQFGAFMMELAENFRAFRAGEETYKLKFYVGHDGTMIRLASLLGFGEIASLRWPALGSSIVFEVWRTGDSYFVRILHEGTPVKGMEWIPFDRFVPRVESHIPDELFDRCMEA